MRARRIKATCRVGVFRMALVAFNHFDGPLVDYFHRYKDTKEPRIVQANKTE